MEEKEKKKYILQIVILSILIFICALSIVWTKSISLNIQEFLYNKGVRESNSDLVVHYINVGQGDAIALKFPNDEIMLIDAGPKIAQNSLITYIKDNVLKSNKDLVIDYLILTHSDIDHSGGICAIFTQFEVKNFYRPNIACESENVENFAMQSTLDEYNEVIENSKQEKGLNTNILNKEFNFNVGKARVEILSPLKVYSTTNAMSPIIKVSYLDKSFLFTGDVQYEAEKDMLEYYGDKLDADVLKVAHHGSNTSTSMEFVEAVTPQYAIISVGENSYGHPTFETITTLNAFGAEVLLTSKGDIRLVCGEGFFEVLEEKAVQSSEFVKWWIIAIAINLILIYFLIKVIINFIKKEKEEFNI